MYANALFQLILSLACLLPTATYAASWTASVDQRNGLPSVSLSGSTALSSDFVFWGKDWVWADMATDFKVVAPFEYRVAGRNQALNFDLTARVVKPSNRQLVWQFDIEARGTMPDVIGGGISFQFDVANLSSSVGEPELLPDNRGWTWGRTGRGRVEMRFDPPLAKIYFERGIKSEIRAFFYQGEVPQGQRRYIGNPRCFRRRCDRPDHRGTVWIRRSYEMADGHSRLGYCAGRSFFS